MDMDWVKWLDKITWKELEMIYEYRMASNVMSPPHQIRVAVV